MNFWRRKQAKDEFYRKAKSDGYRSRSAYKLIEIQEKFQIIKRQSKVLDLGSAPGGWLQVIRRYTEGFIGGIDLQDIEMVHNVHFIQLDFTKTQEVENFLVSVNAPREFDVLLSDMSPFVGGDRESDHYQSVELVEIVYEFAQTRLRKEGYMVCKLFDGHDTNELLAKMKRTMSVRIFKPSSSRSESREIYLVCQSKNS